MVFFVKNGSQIVSCRALEISFILLLRVSVNLSSGASMLVSGRVTLNPRVYGELCRCSCDSSLARHMTCNVTHKNCRSLNSYRYHMVLDS